MSIKLEITFEGTANPIHNLSLCGSHKIGLIHILIDHVLLVKF